MSTLTKRFLWALGVSVLVHLLLLLGPKIRLPSPHTTSQLQIYLPAAVTAPVKAAQAPRKIAPRKKPVPKPAAPQTAATPAAITDHAVDSPQPEPMPDSPTPPVPPAPLQSAAAAPAPPALPALPQRVEIQYTLYKGVNGLNVGRVAHVWQTEGDRYKLTSTAEASGLFSLFVHGTQKLISQGRITASGLQPESFLIQRGQSPDATDTAQFDWQAHTLEFGNSTNRRSVALPDNTQDLLSFVYQLALLRPQSGSVQLYIATGRKLDTYTYQVIGEEELELPQGRIKTVHLSKQHAPGEDETDIWLAREYNYTPAKILQKDKSGGILQQIADQFLDK